MVAAVGTQLGMNQCVIKSSYYCLYGQTMFVPHAGPFNLLVCNISLRWFQTTPLRPSLRERGKGSVRPLDALIQKTEPMTLRHCNSKGEPSSVSHAMSCVPKHNETYWEEGSVCACRVRKEEWGLGEAQEWSFKTEVLDIYLFICLFGAERDEG